MGKARGEAEDEKVKSRYFFLGGIWGLREGTAELPLLLYASVGKCGKAWAALRGKPYRRTADLTTLVRACSILHSTPHDVTDRLYVADCAKA